MENVYRILEANSVNRPVGVTLMERHNLENGAPSESLQGFHRWVLFAALRRVESLANVPLHRPRKRLQVSPR